MVFLHPLSDFIDCKSPITNSSPTYYYQGICPQTGELLQLPRTPLAEAIGHGLMQYLATDEVYSREGKMYGILLVELPNGEQKILKAFSGLLNGCSLVEGWVPPIPGRNALALEENRTLAQLDAIKQEFLTLQQLKAREDYERLALDFEVRYSQMSDRHQKSKQQRQEKRQLLCKTLTKEALPLALEDLDEQSRQEGIQRRRLKRQRDEALQPLKVLIDAADERIRELKKKRKQLSRELQTQMHSAYTLMNFLGQSVSLKQLIPGGLPTGTGDCCAPKLLHYAAEHNLKPSAIAEFWWGASSSDKIPGEFYGACGERCQPLMGFLLSGLKPNPPAPLPPLPNPLLQGERKGELFLLPSPARGGVGGEVAIIYQDEWLIAVNKPAGLLSVPGRYLDTQDSVLSRLRNLFPEGMNIIAVHRLDQDTSGILLFARDKQTYRHLSQQFEQRQVDKVYEAVLCGILTTDAGVIELPLWGNPQNRPYQEVNWEYGNKSVTRFQVIAREGNQTRVEFIPLTGRTHQLRVHAADGRGLNVPILGDRLYGGGAVSSRLHLHARELSFEHPVLGERMQLFVKTGF
ncbi:MAG: pseudouridine synthase [Nostocaceae cyanobacterium]|nr:pseudouridine synthase [Nostocaceae cyanobacterium]